MMKYVHNLCNATKISFFNEMHVVCQKLGIDSQAVNFMVAKSAEALWNPKYGAVGGSPYGGSCLPKDIRAFRSFVHELNLNHMHLLDAVIRVNEEMGEQVPNDELCLEFTQVFKDPCGMTALVVTLVSGFLFRTVPLRLFRFVCCDGQCFLNIGKEFLNRTVQDFTCP